MRESRVAYVFATAGLAAILTLSGCGLWRSTPPHTTSTQPTPATTASAPVTAPATPSPTTSATPGRVASPSPEPTKTPAGVPAATLESLKASAKTAALAYAKQHSAPDVGTITATRIRMARTSHGIWWASVDVKPSNAGVDAAGVFLKRSGDHWVIVDFGTGITPKTDPRFPRDVAGQL